MEKEKVQMVKVEEQNNPKVEPPYCEKHSRIMVKKSHSERGLPIFYCEGGTQVEKGKARISKVLERRGYGFIKLNYGKDLFFHASNTLDELDELKRGDWVEFRIGVNPRKEEIQAVRVKKATKNRGSKR